MKMLMNAHQSLKIVVTEALSEPMLTAIPAFAGEKQNPRHVEARRGFLE